MDKSNATFVFGILKHIRVRYFNIRLVESSDSLLTPRDFSCCPLSDDVFYVIFKIS